MHMFETYKIIAEFAQTWGLIYFVLSFAAVLLYAFWPSRRQVFHDAAQMPLQED